MVRTFMDQQAATVALIAVPATEIVCAMGGVEHPFKVYTGHSADRPRSD
ncbi:hypothetical protein ANO14919_010540 [Xylariales sp. No.14919]|nr:hypothetical protein ANO14919_010540 [Xylariales sp. No.14919]